jgi:hypothetical protein
MRDAMRRFLLSATMLGLVVVAAGQAEADIILGDPADAERRGDGSKSMVNGDQLVVGKRNNTGAAAQSNAIFVFDLTGVAGELLTADLGLFFLNKTGTSPTFNGDLYGVGFSSSATSFPNRADFNQAPSDTTGPTVIKIQDNFVTPTTTAGRYLNTNSAGDTLLVAYLNTLRPSGPGGDFAFFRLSQDAQAPAVNNAVAYAFSAADETGTSQDPVLTFTIDVAAVPEPSTFVSAGIAGLIGCGVAWRRRKRAA